MRVMILGSRGMLGQDLAQTLPLASADLHTILLSRQDWDLSSPAVPKELLPVLAETDVMINAAAYTDVNGAETHREEAWAANAKAPENLANLALEFGIRLVHVSTDYVFDGSKAQGYNEADQTGPLNAYGASKLDGEKAILEIAPDRAAIVRTSWLFGISGKCFPKTILQAAKSGRPLRVVSDQWGCPTFSRDLADLLWNLAAIPNSPQSTGVFHGTNSGTTTWYDFARSILAAAQLENHPIDPVPAAEYPTPAVRPRYSILKSRRLEPLGISALPAWNNAVERYVRLLNP